MHIKPIVLFRFCSSSTPLNCLQSRRRWLDLLVTAWLVSVGGMIEGIGTTLFFDHSKFTNFATLCFKAVALLTSIPAIACIAGVDECNRELARRDSLSAGYIALDDRFPRYVGRILLLVLAMIGLQLLFRRH